MIDKFPCTSCGLCCQRIQDLKEFSSKLAIEKGIPEIEFPYSNTNGVCEKYIDNKCSVYESRPLICSVDKMQGILKIDKAVFYGMNAEICNSFIKESGIGESYLINL